FASSGDRGRAGAADQQTAPRIRLRSTLLRQGPVPAVDGSDPGQADHPAPARALRRGGRLRLRAPRMSAAIEAIMRSAPVIPVLVIEDADMARPLAEALVAGGLRVLEVTLRTPAALDAIRAMKQVPGAIVGAGTVLNPRMLKDALDAGSEFIVSPGLTDSLGEAAVASGIPFLPGVANASNIMAGLDLGLDSVKFFP